MATAIKEVIILAGGLGTRLRSAVPDLPKCMAPVNGQPFVAWVIDYLRQQKVEHFIFALGYKNEVFLDFLQQNFGASEYSLSIEEEPLGTGGAIQLACNAVKDSNVLVTNGDTLFKVDLSLFADFHIKQNAECTLALKPMQAFNRYGAVEKNEKDIITRFKEKQYFEKGLINGGLYAVNVNRFINRNLPLKFSFESGYLEQFYIEGNIMGQVQDGYFIDIGIPEDYARAQQELNND